MGIFASRAKVAATALAAALAAAAAATFCGAASYRTTMGSASDPGPPSPVAAARAPLGGQELARPGVIVNYPSRRAPRIPKLRADAFVVADATTGQILAAKNPHRQYGPASTLKILTAISLIPVLNPDATVVASGRAVSVEPDIVGLKRGYRYKIADLFRALLLVSGNDAAVALAEATGSFSRGVALMNAEARHLRAYDTVAKQPNGLDAAGQHVSAYDQALIARCALALPAFLRYDETLEASFPITVRHRIQLFNQDRLLTEYPGFLGGKTGWTTPAMATYVGMARRHGHTLIVTLLHAVPGTIFASATALLNWGFRVDGRIAAVGWLAKPVPTAAAAATARPRPGAARTASGRMRQERIRPIAGPFAAGFATVMVIALGAHGIARRRRRSARRRAVAAASARGRRGPRGREIGQPRHEVDPYQQAHHYRK